ncbi:hypothetical protein [Algihabitans albus]|uniref:hypothetical protein n=1 Tax=Algihabitans albus TaxID=2164067 RepID=UPI000E5DA1E0|nr:hypothetical protein [Algihabitans albus]
MVDAKMLYPTTPARRLDDSRSGADDERARPLDLAGRGFASGFAGAEVSPADLSGEGTGVPERPERDAKAAAEETAQQATTEMLGEAPGETPEPRAELTPEQRTALFYTAPDGPVATAGQVALGLSGFFDGLQASLSDAPERCDQAAEAERALPAALSEAGLAAGDLRELTGLIEGYVRAVGEMEPGQGQEQIEQQEKRQGQDYARAEARLRETFGPRAGPLLADARAAVALVERRSPGFKAWLDATGAGNDPRILRAAIRAGRRLRREGRL